MTSEGIFFAPRNDNLLYNSWTKPKDNQTKPKDKKYKLKSRKKKILLLVLALFLLYAIWLSFNILRFKTYKDQASKSSPLEIEGVYHIHTTYSDGRKSLDEIAKLASQANIDFIVLTDHGNPNYESYSSQGWKEGVLVLA